jgi:hypothetical protein
VSTLILAGVDSHFSEASLTGDGKPYGRKTPMDDVAMPAVEAGRTIVRELAKGEPEIQVIADGRAKKALLMQRVRPRSVFRRMAELARMPGWK